MISKLAVLGYLIIAIGIVTSMQGAANLTDCNCQLTVLSPTVETAFNSFAVLFVGIAVVLIGEEKSGTPSG